MNTPALTPRSVIMKRICPFDVEQCPRRPFWQKSRHPADNRPQRIADCLGGVAPRRLIGHTRPCDTPSSENDSRFRYK